jgi:hypothetical protein
MSRLHFLVITAFLAAFINTGCCLNEHSRAPEKPQELILNDIDGDAIPHPHWESNNLVPIRVDGGVGP